MNRFSERGVRESSGPRRISRWFAVIVLLVVTSAGYSQVDPGIRGGPPGAGQPFASGLTPSQVSFFNELGVTQFTETEVVADGLGPRFNLDSCSGCHAFPTVGGSSPLTNNPQVVTASAMAPGNTITAAA